MKMLEDDAIRLRALEPEDLEFLYRWENETSLWDVGNTLAPYSRYNLKQYIAQSHEDIYTLRQLRLVIEAKETHLPLGMIDLFDFEPHHRRAAVGILIIEARRGEGIGRRALCLLHSYAFEFLRLHQLYAHIPAENEASRRLFLGTGYKESGRLKEWLVEGGKYQDVVVVQKMGEEK